MSYGACFPQAPQIMHCRSSAATALVRTDALIPSTSADCLLARAEMSPSPSSSAMARPTRRAHLFVAFGDLFRDAITAATARPTAASIVSDMSKTSPIWARADHTCGTLEQVIPDAGVNIIRANCLGRRARNAPRYDNPNSGCGALPQVRRGAFTEAERGLNGKRFSRLSRPLGARASRAGETHASVPHDVIGHGQGEQFARGRGVVVGALRQPLRGLRVVKRGTSASGRDDRMANGVRDQRGWFGSSHLLPLQSAANMLRRSAAVIANPNANIVEPRA